ncbi:MAG: Gfo/Idh/MocA family protein [Armatimonadota bacterium]
MKTYRVGVASLVHDHVWGELEHWAAHPQAEVVAVGETDPRLLDRFRTAFPAARVHAGPLAMLAAEGGNLDIVQIAAENARHADISEAAFGIGCHVITEKPMASCLDHAERMLSASRSADRMLMVNWPTAWSAAWQEFERLIVAGAIGDLRYFKYRSAHNGPKEIGCDPAFWAWLYDEELNGAGAYMDYCCYGAAMAARFLGLPCEVIGMRAVLAKDYPLPDDNALVGMRYPHAFAVAEASWTQPIGYATPNPYAYGSQGSLCIQDGKVRLQKVGEPNPEIIDPRAPEAPNRNAPEHMIHCLEHGIEPSGVCSAVVSRNAQEILEAGLRAADSGCKQTVPVGRS